MPRCRHLHRRDVATRAGRRIATTTNIGQLPVMPIVALLLCALMFGCGGVGCPRVLFPSRDAAQLTVNAIAHPVRTVRAEARVERRDAEGRIRGTVFMLLARPNRVRFDAMTQFGPAAILTSDGNQFAFTDLRENRYLEGEPCAENVARMLGLPVAPEEALNFLLGRPPQLDENAAADGPLQCGGGRVRLRGVWQGAEGVAEFEIAPNDGELPPEEQHWRAVFFEQRTGNGDINLRVEWSDYRYVVDDQDGRSLALPHQIRFVSATRNADTVVRVGRLAINVALEDDMFHQDVRPGLTAEHVLCE